MWWAVASAVISAVAGILFREWQHRSQIKAMRDVIAAKNAEIEAIKKRISEYGKQAASAPAFDPGNIQL